MHRIIVPLALIALVNITAFSAPVEGGADAQADLQARVESVELRVAALETPADSSDVAGTRALAAAVQRIAALEKKVQELESKLEAREAADVAAAAAMIELGSKWRGQRIGTLSGNKPFRDAVSAEVLEVGDESFRIRVKCREDLAFTFDCQKRDGRYLLARAEANPAGGGNVGEKIISRSRVTVRDGVIEIFWETPHAQGPIRETYRLQPDAL